MPIGEIPTETARVAKAAFPKGTLVMRLREEFADLFAHLIHSGGHDDWKPQENQWLGGQAGWHHRVNPSSALSS